MVSGMNEELEVLKIAKQLGVETLYREVAR